MLRRFEDRFASKCSHQRTLPRQSSSERSRQTNLTSPIGSKYTMSTPSGLLLRDQWPHHCSMCNCRLLRRSAQHYMRSTDKWHPFSFSVSKYGFEPTSLAAMVDIWEFSKVCSHQSAGIDISPCSAANIAPIRSRENSLNRMLRLIG